MLMIMIIFVVVLIELLLLLAVGLTCFLCKANNNKLLWNFEGQSGLVISDQWSLIFGMDTDEGF